MSRLTRWCERLRVETIDLYSRPRGDASVVEHRSAGRTSATIHGASDWPSIYGPRRNHGSDQKGLLRAWPQASGFKPIASAVVLEPGDNWAPLALVDGKLLIRGQKELKVLQVAQ